MALIYQTVPQSTRVLVLSDLVENLDSPKDKNLLFWLAGRASPAVMIEPFAHPLRA